MAESSFETLEKLFHPRSVAVVGSTSAGKIGAALVEQILAGGYTGQVYAANPKAAGFGPVPGYASLVEIGKPVDLAIVASPAATVAGVLKDCAEAGVPVALVITAGFREAGNVQGEGELVDIARAGGVRLVGPNTAGVVCTSSKLYATLEVQPPAGKVAFVSQSGALGGVVLAAAKERGLGISKFISYGNNADLTQVDFLHYLASDAETGVVALYIESVSQGGEFMQALAECARAKPVVVLKAGRTEAGSRATASHTGALAGSDAVYGAAIAQCGAVRVRSVDELIDLCSAFSSLPPMRGRRLAIVTNSGGPGVLAVDLAEELGLQAPEPSAGAQASLRPYLPAHASLHNPVDLTVEGTRQGFERALKALLPEVDAALAINVATPYLDSLALAEGILAGAAESGKPVVSCFLPAGLVSSSITRLEASSIPNFPSGERAVTALAYLASYAEAQARRRAGDEEADRAERKKEGWTATRDGHLGASCTPGLETPSIDSGADPRRVSPATHGLDLPAEGPLLEPFLMDWLESNGLPTPRRAVAASAEAAAGACAQVGFPAVMKVVSPQILHKSDAGGVVVGIRDEAEARRAFEAIQEGAAGKTFRGVIVYPQIRNGVEVLLGIFRDPQFGPVVAFGLGGIFTELWRDVTVRVAPVSEAEAGEMIAGTRASRLLAGLRGRPPCDLAALRRLIAQVSRLPFAYPELAELDLNPVFALPDGAVVGDVRVIIAVREFRE